jgi:hypothetical protein
MPGVRDQVVYTPQSVVDGLLKFWPGGVAYDAAGADGSLVAATKTTEHRGLIDPWPDRTYCNPPYGASLFDPANEFETAAAEVRIRNAAKAAGKKSVKWPKGMPIKKAGLKDWLSFQLDMSEGESIMLVPNRTHRKWLRAWRREVHALVELDPLTFRGHKQAFPAPLVLGLVRVGPYVTEVSKVFHRIQAFYRAFAHLGDPA